MKTQVLHNYSHSTSLGFDTLECMGPTVEEPQVEILNLVVTKELEEYPPSLLKNIRVLSKPDFLIKQFYEDSYYQDIIHDRPKL